MGKVAAVERAHLACEQRDDGYRLPGERHELHFIALAAFVDVYERADVPRLQPLFRDVCGQHHAIVLFNHAETSSNGLAQGQPIALKSFVLRVATEAPVRTAIAAINPSARLGAPFPVRRASPAMRAAAS